MEEGPKATKSWGTVGGGGRGRESHSKTPHQHALGLKRLSAKKGEPPPCPPPPVSSLRRAASLCYKAFGGRAYSHGVRKRIWNQPGATGLGK